jgi:hypothetical protein
MAGICPICGQPNNARDYVYCTMCKDQAREAELNSGRQEKLPFAQLVLKPTIAGNAYPGKLSGYDKTGYYDMKYGVHVPAGGKIKIEPVEGFDSWVRVIVYSKYGIVQCMKHMDESEINGVSEKYADIDPGNTAIKYMKFYPAGTTEI